VWTVVHSHLPHVFVAIEYATRLSAEPVRASSLGYHLACLEAACIYVADTSREQLLEAHTQAGASVRHAVRPRVASDAARGPEPAAGGAGGAGGAGPRRRAASSPHAAASGAGAGEAGSEGGAFATSPPGSRASDATAERAQLASFLRQERDVTELLDALVL